LRQRFLAEAPFDHQEHLVFVGVVMKHELALRRSQFHLLSVEFAGDARLVVLRNLREFFGNVHLLHRPGRVGRKTKAASSG
jgi:hypothetical protein